MDISDFEDLANARETSVTYLHWSAALANAHATTRRNFRQNDCNQTSRDLRYFRAGIGKVRPLKPFLAAPSDIERCINVRPSKAFESILLTMPLNGKFIQHSNWIFTLALDC